MAETNDTVGDLDEQVSAQDMRDLMAEVPGGAVPVVTEPITNEAIRTATVATPEKPKEEKPVASPAIGASMPSDADVTLPKAASGEKELKARKEAAKPEQKPSPLTYQDPILNMFRNPDGTLKRGLPQDTNKNGTAGRPTVMTDEILLKLEAAFCMGCTDKEACQFAGIGLATLYNYQKDHPEFLEEKDLWKENPILKARMTVYTSMGFNAELAMKFLERKKRDEFATRQEHTGGGDDAPPIKLEYVVPEPEPDTDTLQSDAETTSSVVVDDGSNNE